MSFSFSPADCHLPTFEGLVSRKTDRATLRFAARVEQEVPIYDGPALLAADRTAVMREICDVLLNGAGVIAITRAYTDTAPIDAATAIYHQIIADEKAAGAVAADHFSAATNDRVWNSLQKLCEADPATFAAYFGNPAIDLACTAWLGPNYQMTAQVNLVYPGGVAQTCHRDYHLGFQSPEVSALYPPHVHDLSPVLTLQGAVAHCDMPIESGPTKLLPFSQLYRPGYAAYRLPEFQAYFEANHIQIPLAKGDALFFNPALFHAAGANTSADINRMANLLQISSAFGRAMETVDRSGMIKALYPVLLTLPAGPERDAAIAAAAEGYSFPTNLDRDPPSGGWAPETQAALTHRALATGMSADAFADAIDAMDTRHGA